MINNTKSWQSSAVDLLGGGIRTFGHGRMNQDDAGKLVIGLINNVNSFGTGLIGNNVKNVVND
jgi:hypothetical protein